MSPRLATLGRIVGKLALALVFTAGVVVLMLYLVGTFSPKVAPASPPAAGRPVGDRPVATVRRLELPVSEAASGRIEAVHESQVAPKVMGRVLELTVKADQRVARDQVLARLDDADLKARQKQAEADLDQAKAARDRARSDHERIKGLRAERAASAKELDDAATTLQRAEAAVRSAQEAARAAAAVLEFATIRSPMDGIVLKTLVKEGDTVAPGQVMLRIYDPTRMQMIASVRESLVRRLTPQQPVEVSIDALGLACHGQVSEIVRESDPASRAFQVKVTGPCRPEVQSGMYARLMVPLEPQPLLTIPAAAVQRVGQLTLVEVAHEDRLVRRAVQTGRTLEGGQWVEVLSGLREGERVALAAP